MASDKKSKRLQELKGSGFEITDGQPDIRGWEVYDEEGRKIGKVDELIFDSRARTVRYIILNVLDVRELELEKRTVVVPIGLAELDKADDHVVLHQVTPFQLRALPKYDKSVFGPKSERSISTVFGRKYTSHTAEEADVENDFYEHDHFNQENLQRRRKSTSTINKTNDFNDSRDKDYNDIKGKDYNDDDKHIRQRDELNMAASNTNDETDLFKRQREQNLRDEEEIRRRNEENLRHEEELRRRRDSGI